MSTEFVLPLKDYGKVRIPLSRKPFPHIPTVIKDLEKRLGKTVSYQVIPKGTTHVEVLWVSGNAR